MLCLCNSLVSRGRSGSINLKKTNRHTMPKLHSCHTFQDAYIRYNMYVCACDMLHVILLMFYPKAKSKFIYVYNMKSGKNLSSSNRLKITIIVIFGFNPSGINTRV